MYSPYLTLVRVYVLANTYYGKGDRCVRQKSVHPEWCVGICQLAKHPSVEYDEGNAHITFRIYSRNTTHASFFLTYFRVGRIKKFRYNPSKNRVQMYRTPHVPTARTGRARRCPRLMESCSWVRDCPMSIYRLGRLYPLYIHPCDDLCPARFIYLFANLDLITANYFSRIPCVRDFIVGEMKGSWRRL